MWELHELDWQWVVAVKLMGIIHGVTALVPHLVRSGRGHVVNTASAAGIAIIPGSTSIRSPLRRRGATGR
jgi:NADP-dependent 3-hydroxy acid dehydrogenase YdfG